MGSFLETFMVLKDMIYVLVGVEPINKPGSRGKVALCAFYVALNSPYGDFFL
jgi:hypothetical protein